MPTQPTYKKIEGELYLYEATYPSGEKRYAVMGSRSGVPGIKQKFPFTAAGLKEATEIRDEWLTKSNKILAKKQALGEIVDPAVKKLKNPPDPKKPWRYLRTGTGDQRKRINQYFATEAEAKAAQTAAKKAKIEAQTKIRQSDFADIKKLIKEEDFQLIKSNNAMFDIVIKL